MHSAVLALDRRALVGRWTQVRFVRYSMRLLRITLIPILAFSVVVGPSALRAGGTLNAQSVDLRVDLAAQPRTSRVHRQGTVLAPGDSLEQVLDLRGPSKAKGSVTLMIVPVDGRSSLLDTDRVSGLQLSIAECNGKNAKFRLHGATEKCAQGHMTSLAQTPVADAEARAITLSGAVLARTMHLRLLITFPHSAGNRFQDAASTLDFRFTVRAKLALR